ncbi:MAG TPA: DUF2231 domain-containing protein, partial [Methylomirabilota bacterium]|nr:DUF2231 domain-containing protein [Methylomirabilota bacterium]
TVAAAFTLPVIATGLAAWQWQLEGQRLKGVLLYHLVSGLLASVFIWVSWWIHFRESRRKTSALPLWRIAVEVVSVMFVGLAGHLGGILSGVNS